MNMARGVVSDTLSKAIERLPSLFESFDDCAVVSGEVLFVVVVETEVGVGIG